MVDLPPRPSQPENTVLLPRFRLGAFSFPHSTHGDVLAFFSHLFVIDDPCFFPLEFSVFSKLSDPFFFCFFDHPLQYPKTFVLLTFRALRILPPFLRKRKSIEFPPPCCLVALSFSRQPAGPYLPNCVLLFPHRPFRAFYTSFQDFFRFCPILSPGWMFSPLGCCLRHFFSVFESFPSFSIDLVVFDLLNVFLAFVLFLFFFH